ncbi:hypothetical protein CKAH01_00766 [Colletotrichum kahawae]|uniref:Uncharacterized protein n=1 Tax=Colletotrichum kahawae TaxID=34407 RepID=A0AAD9YL31_COLKA|nr:hypothetical protein CKAH01_00766 [Colletotrichum kahawae]
MIDGFQQGRHGHPSKRTNIGQFHLRTLLPTDSRSSSYAVTREPAPTPTRQRLNRTSGLAWRGCAAPFDTHNILTTAHMPVVSSGEWENAQSNDYIILLVMGINEMAPAAWTIAAAALPDQPMARKFHHVMPSFFHPNVNLLDFTAKCGNPCADSTPSDWPVAQQFSTAQGRGHSNDVRQMSE